MFFWKPSIIFTSVIAANGLSNFRQSTQVTLQAHGRLPLNETYPEQWFEQPLDHFSGSGHSFQQRFWCSDKHYVPGGPIFILDGGEVSGEERLPFLDTGIVNILAKATHGFGIVLEHRYYGKSIAVKNLTTDSLYWLNNAQSAADSANFIRNYKVNGTPLVEAGPVIYYGGSYAGARAAHMRVLYPDIVYGAIASSAVVHAQYAIPEYMDVIRKAGPKTCIEHIEDTIESVDEYLAIPAMRNATKALFGLEELNDQDFAMILTRPLAWQSLVWDPEYSDTSFFDFCDALAREPRRSMDFHGVTLNFVFLNYVQWIREKVVDDCDKPVQECFFDDFSDVSLEATGRLWLYQTCTEWGYYQSAPLDPTYPRIISRLVTADYNHMDCVKAFPPGKFNSIPNRPDVTVVNELGDFGLSADRLAFIDGEADPWRPMTPHSQYAPPRVDTLNQPFKLIPGAVHHWDEYGLEDSTEEPAEIQVIHKEMIEFVRHWIKDWEPTIHSAESRV